MLSSATRKCHNTDGKTTQYGRPPKTSPGFLRINDYITVNDKIWLNYIIFRYRTLRKGKLRTKNASIYVYDRKIHAPPSHILPTHITPYNKCILRANSNWYVKGGKSGNLIKKT